MKRFLAGVAVFALIAGFASVQQAQAAADDWDDAVITVTVTEAASGIEVVVDPTGFGNQVIGTTVYSNNASGHPRVTIRNVGSIVGSLRAQVTNIGADGGNTIQALTLGTTMADVGADKAVLAGVFTVWGSAGDAGGRDLNASDFQDDDVMPVKTGVPDVYRNASATAFASPNDDATPTLRGINLNPGDERSMRFALVLPTSAPNSRFIGQSITITYNRF